MIRTSPPPAPLGIRHIVLFDLVDESDSGLFIAECAQAMRRIDAVESFSVGRPMLTDRPVALADYDVALHLHLRSEAALAEYGNHPAHRELVENWRDRIEWMRVIDVVEDIR